MTRHAATDVAQQMLLDEKRLLQEADHRALLQPALHRSEHAERALHSASKSAGLQNLERFERALQFLFVEGGVRLGYLQMKFLHAARIILLQRMFGADLVHHMDALRARFKVRRIVNSAAILFPRRSGKTTVQTILAAVILVSQPDGNVVNLNPGGRQARAFLSQTIRYLEIFKKSPEFSYVEVHRDMRETIAIKNITGTIARISSFPGTIS